MIKTKISKRDQKIKNYQKRLEKLPKKYKKIYKKLDAS